MSDIMPAGPNPRPDWADEDWEIFGTWIRNVLRTNIVQVTFTKVDGSERTLKCTLNPDFLPIEVITENKKERKQSTSSIAVFDVDLDAWRSFRVKDVKQLVFNIGDDTVPFPTYNKP